MKKANVKRTIFERKTIRRKQKEVKELEGKRGITLIALIVTIIVLLILAGVTIATLNGDNGILTKADEAKLSTELSRYKEELELYKVEKYGENSNFEEETLTAGKVELNYNTKESGETGNIKTIIPDISDEYFEKLEVIKGELLINTQNKNEVKVAQRLGIEVNPYDIRDGVLLSSNGNLLLMDENTGSLTIPDSVTAIGEGAFANLEGLRTIIIPSTVKRIEKNAFRNNTTLETVIMQEKVNEDGTIEGVEYIGIGAFGSCGNLKNIQFAQNALKEIRDEAFMGCNSIEEIEIPENVTTIAAYIFSSCRNLKEIKLPETLISINSQAFGYCISLESITIPENVTNIGLEAFGGCVKLENIVLNTNKYIYQNGILMTNTEIPQLIFISDVKLKEIDTFSIPEGIENFSINISAYTNIKTIHIPQSLKQLTANSIPKSVEKIELSEGNKNFKVQNDCLYDYDMKELKLCYTKETEVQLYDKIERIKSNAFSLSTNLESITLPDTVIEIESNAFSGIQKLKNVYIGKNVASISPMFCYGNFNVNVQMDADNPYYKLENNIIYDIREKDNLKLVTVLYAIKGEFRIDEKVKSIGSYAFHNQNQMTSIYIPNGVEDIEDSFNYCTKLTEINIPESVKNISVNCFNNSPNLVKIKIDKPYQTIEGSPWGCIYGDRAIEWKE